MTQFPEPEQSGQMPQGDEPLAPADTSSAAASSAADASAPAALDLPHTGDEKVDQALERLLAVPQLPPAEQVEVYVGVHRDLQDRLADLEG